jgi:hypothetical protein
LAIEPIHFAAARTAVALAGTVSRAIGSATEEMAGNAKQSFAAVFAGNQADDSGGSTSASLHKPSAAERLTNRIRDLLSGAGIDLMAPVRFAIGTEQTLVVDATHPQKHLIEIAIAHDQTIEQLLESWQVSNQSAGQYEPLELMIEPSFSRDRPF